MSATYRVDLLSDRRHVVDGDRLLSLSHLPLHAAFADQLLSRDARCRETSVAGHRRCGRLYLPDPAFPLRRWLLSVDCTSLLNRGAHCVFGAWPNEDPSSANGGCSVWRRHG